MVIVSSNFNVRCRGGTWEIQMIDSKLANQRSD